MSRREKPLTREELLDAALAIVDAEGLAALTMRRLADAVGVEAMSLYHHVPSKAVLLDWTLDRMRAEMRLPDPLPGDWPSVLEAIFAEYRRVLTAHPNMLALSARRTDATAASGFLYLIEQGFSETDATQLYQSLVAFTLGYSMFSSASIETAWAGLPRELAAQVQDWKEATFRRTIRIVMSGYTARERGKT